MYTHIAKDGSTFKIPNQAKNALDHTIQANDNVKKKIKNERKELIGATVDQQLYNIKGAGVSIRVPRKK